jgi:protein-tyrosine phosphatase
MHRFIAPALLGLSLLAVSAQAAEPVKIAFVDTGNTGRSISAEMLATVLIRQRGANLAVISRALDLDPFDVKTEAHAATLLRERGIETGAHRAAQMTANDAQHADLILTMTAKHRAKVIELYPAARDKTWTLAEYATGTTADVADAWGKPMEAYVAMFKQLDAWLPVVVDKAAARAVVK